jgi:hypothetical protein
MFTQNSIDNFWSGVNKNGPNGCWLWTKAVDQDGYGRGWYKIINDPKRYPGRAHRMVLMFQTMQLILPGLVAMHHCDNPSCCNPAHLSIGTVLENNLDKIAKGRENSAKGERNARAKLTDDQVREIRKRAIIGTRSGYGQGSNSVELAKEFGVHTELIRRIAKGFGWSHVI